MSNATIICDGYNTNGSAPAEKKALVMTWVDRGIAIKDSLSSITPSYKCRYTVC